jgi:hypothetical protein
MNILLAHHLEPQHLPVLVCLFAAGFYIGWQALSHWFNRSRAGTADPTGTAPTNNAR